jgi:hypothetical protein
MSAIPPKADIAERDHHVRFVPQADQLHRTKMARYSITSLERHAAKEGERSDADDVTLLIVH